MPETVPVQPLLRVCCSSREAPFRGWHADAVELSSLVYATASFILHRLMTIVRFVCRIFRRLAVWCRVRLHRAVLALRLMRALPEIVLVVLAVEAIVAFLFIVMLAGVMDSMLGGQARQNVGVMWVVFIALFWEAGL